MRDEAGRSNPIVELTSIVCDYDVCLIQKRPQSRHYIEITLWVLLVLGWIIRLRYMVDLLFPQPLIGEAHNQWFTLNLEYVRVPHIIRPAKDGSDF